MKKAIIILSLVFVFISFFPSLWEIFQSGTIPNDRMFVLEHNYLFDYNFYLSRIKEGMEGRFQVVEKYYNLPHTPSLFQVIYLYLGKAGSLFSFSPPMVYHLTRLIFGLVFLCFIGNFIGVFFSKKWQIPVFLLVVTASSWPIFTPVGNFWRFGSFMGWWSAIDVLSRVTFIPHVLFGQIFILLFIWRFSVVFNKNSLKRLILWGLCGFFLGIVFPPTLIVVYSAFIFMSFFEFIFFYKKVDKRAGVFYMDKNWLREKIVPRTFFVIFSLPAFLYLNLMFKVFPWSELVQFDIKHRTLIPYTQYALALGPVLPLGIAGIMAFFLKREKKFISVVSWVFAVVLLFVVFERVPQQSPLRFTEASVQIPLGILSGYFFLSFISLFKNQASLFRFVILKKAILVIFSLIILTGFGVMISSLLWQIDQAEAKRTSGWLVPIGTQIAYPLKDFMRAITFLSLNSSKREVVLSYVTAGNYIPAYAGNFVYLGHANTPDEDNKEKIAAGFFRGDMSSEKAKEFINREKITYVFFGPQEAALGRVGKLEDVYPFLKIRYKNNRVTIYSVN